MLHFFMHTVTGRPLSRITTDVTNMMLYREVDADCVEHINLRLTPESMCAVQRLRQSVFARHVLFRHRIH